MPDVIKDSYELDPHIGKQSRDDKGAPYFYAFSDTMLGILYFTRYPRRLREEVICRVEGNGLEYYQYISSTWQRLYPDTGSVPFVEYTADSVTKNTGGTATGSVTDTQTLMDGNEYHVVEAASTPGFDIEFAFSDVDSIGKIAVSAHYDIPASTHSVQIQLYDYTNTAWVTVHTFTDTYDFAQHFKTIQDDTDFIDGSDNAKLRLYHPELGSTSHDIHIDYVALFNDYDQGAVGPQGVQGVAGEGIPTGGTDGQVLAKASGDDYDTEWISRSSIIASVSNNYIVADNVGLVLADSSGGLITIDTSGLTATANWELAVKKTDSSTNTVRVLGTIDGDTNFDLLAEDEVINIKTDGSEWWVNS